jgi:5-methylcytosine-specific restriction endonuclease McrA
MWEIANHPKPARQQPRQKVVYAEYIRSPEWAKVKTRKFKQVGHRCEKCAKHTGLQVHHKTYDRLGRERLSDLQVLCSGCHEREHEGYIMAKRHLDSIAREGR